MKRTFTVSFGITLILVLLLGITPSVRAALNAMNLVSETNSTYTLRTGTAWQSRLKVLMGQALTTPINLLTNTCRAMHWLE